MEANCVMCLYDDHYEIAGPFNDHDALIAWAEAWQERNSDDPRWPVAEKRRETVD